MKKGIFVTATGTDVGKTYISALLLKKLRERGRNAGYFKPALSGALVQNGRLIPGDAEEVCRVSGLPAKPERLVAYLFERAVSPHLASRLEGKQIRLERVLEQFHRVERDYDFLVAEGCGGLICPLSMQPPELMLTDVIRALGFDLLLVADAGLGTINATVLTVEYARRQGLLVRGIILNRFQTGNDMHEDNKAQIERLAQVPILACVEENADYIRMDLGAILSEGKGLNPTVQW